MGRAPCCEKNIGLKKGPWTPEEDLKLIHYIHKHGYGNWRLLPKNAGLQRCGKSCRLRWTNYLRPDIKRGRFSFEEEEAIIQLHTILGNKWSAIASRLPGRTDNEIKNYWNTHVRKRLLRMGIDPVTHTPRLDLLDFSSILTNSSHYGTHQLMVNPEILKLASSLFSSSQNVTQENNNQLYTPQIDQNNQQISHLLQNQSETACVSILPFTELQLVESNANTSNLSDFDFQQHEHAQLGDWLCNDMASRTVTEDYVVPQLPNYNYQSSDYQVNYDAMDPPMSETSNFHSNYNSNHNFSYASVLSTPSSSPTPMNSNSTFIYGSSSTTGEDETEISYICQQQQYVQISNPRYFRGK